VQVRLQKIIADAGIASRRKSEELILQGRVTVNGQVVTQLGSKADPERDHILVDGMPLRRATRRVYWLLNKPVGYVSTVHDPQRRPTVISLLRGIRDRVYPVGRLDYHSSGLLLLTNDGELANFLMSPASGVPRTYHAKLEGVPKPEALQKLAEGIVIDGRRTSPCKVRRLAERDRPWYEMTLVEGRYHQVRRMFERIGQPVVKLKRVRIGFLSDDGLPPGRFRPLTPREVERLKNWKEANPKRVLAAKPDPE
jgi:23S rRNA pseudouridine2605 synthase